MNSQKGFTLIELLIVITMLVVVGGGLTIIGHFVAKFW